MRILAFGTYDVSAHPRVGALVQGLRDDGHDVVEVNRPLGLSTAQRIAMVRQPWRLPLLALRLLRCWTALAWQGARERRRSRPDAVLVGYLGHFDVHLARLLFRGTPIVLDHLVSAAGTVADRGLSSGGPKTRLMRAIDAAALRAADVVVLDTADRLGSLPDAARVKTAVCPVGATDRWFAAGAVTVDRAPRDGLRVVFVGLYTPLHGTPVIAEAIAALADDARIEFTMVGSGQDRPRAERLAAANPRVRWVDWVGGDELPDLVAGHDVSLGIVGTTAKALEVVPTKAYQGAAAATVVVTSDTPPQRAALGDTAVLVPPGDARALADALRRLADDPDSVARLRRSAYGLARERFTAGAVVRPMLDALAALRAPR
ncbi:glycosyltransferase [Nocardioides sp. CER19]|uniref:glycosyltransferase n=1 Tax=Nocardioides sp. CER19 TaxID=3038538 RepID=UPI0024491F06|nr:glycosyltransferase [Nocardioides sp. CER19]MDH2416942.1 glycosyltransferase [Nocardioides sp. CER19]